MPPHEMTTAQLIMSFIILLTIASFTAYYADRKGRSFTLWFIIGVLLGIFAPLILFFLPPSNGSKEELQKKELPNAPSFEPPASPPLPHLGSEDKLWYYLDMEHRQMGPVSLVALRDLWNRGLLELTSYVWTQGMNEWKKVEDLPDLRTSLTN